jgi:hypothetical protein
VVARCSAIDQEQHPRDNAQDGQQETAIGDAQAEQWQEITQDNPQAEQEHAFRAVHTLKHRRGFEAAERTPRYGSATLDDRGLPSGAAAGG